MTFTADPRVDAYIDGLPDWQQAICREVHERVHAADRHAVETIQRIDRPYFVVEGIITSGQENKTARAVAIRRGEKINERALVAMFRAIIANNRAGGWRRLNQDG